MDEHQLEIAGEALELHPERALLWPAQRVAFVADVHIGKSQHFRDHGAAVPEGLDHTLQRLTRVIRDSSCTHLYVLGDFVHTSSSITPEIDVEILEWRSRLPIEMTIVMGNHDRGMGAAFSRWGFEVSSNSVEIGPFELVHDPNSQPGSRYRIAGHVHPTYVLRTRGDRLRLPCLWVGEDLTLLPAFSLFTSGLRQSRDGAKHVFVFFDDRVASI